MNEMTVIERLERLERGLWLLARHTSGGLGQSGRELYRILDEIDHELREPAAPDPREGA